MIGVAALALVVWVYSLAAHGRFCRRVRRRRRTGRARFPSVTAVVPARDEASVIGRSVGSLLEQDYAGPFGVVLVDDSSSDGIGRGGARAGGCA